MTETKNHQKEFIALLLKEKEAIEKWLDSGPDITYFDEENQFILKAIKYGYTNDNSLLTRKSFIHFLNQFCESKIEKSSHENVYTSSSMLDVSINDLAMYRDSIINNYVLKYSISKMNRFSKDIKDDKNPLFALKNMIAECSEIVDATESKNSHIVYKAISDYADEYLVDLKANSLKKESEIYLKTGIKEIDETLGVGLAPGNLTLFCGDTGHGKSSTMLNVAINVWLQGEKVLFVPLEMSYKLMYQRLISRLAKIPFNKFQNPNSLTEDEWVKIKEATDLIKKDKNFYMLETGERTSVETIKRLIKQYVDIFKPRLTVIDYIANLVPDKNTKRTERNDLEIGDMLKALTQMGKPGSIHKDGFHVISGAQVGRDALKRVRRLSSDKISFNSEDLRGSHEYSADAATIYIQMKDPTQPNSRLLLYCIKSRYGSTSFGPTNEVKATLSFRPEICLIESIDDSWHLSSKDEILSKVNTVVTENSKPKGKKENVPDFFDNLDFDITDEPKKKPKKVEIEEDLQL